MTRHLFAIAALLVLAAGCTGSPSAAPATTVRDPAADAMTAMEQGDWARAAELRREALRKEPASLKLRYNLAVAASRLDLVDEAAREFRWILANVAHELPEARTARRWLTEAGLAERSAAAGTTPLASDRIQEETPGDSGVRGRVVWAEGTSTSYVRLFLQGAPKTPLQGLQWATRTDDQGRFEFKRIPAGTYVVTNKVAGRPTWRLRVTLAPGEITTLELGEANRAEVRDDFPETSG